MAMTLKEKRPIRGLEAVAERPDGTRVPFIPYPTPLFDEQGELVGAVSAVVDISERRAAEQRSLDSEIRDRRLAAIVESSDDAILWKDLDGIIASWNKGAERIFGYTADEVVGKPVTILIPPDRQDEEPAILARIRRGERVEHYETIRQRKDGSLINISLTVSPVRDAAGNIVGASKIARDITERKRAEERQRLLLKEMNHRVKNLFAVSSGVVALSARSAKSIDALSSDVRERLAALARAHALTLTEASDEPARGEQATTLHALIATILSPYASSADPAERFTIRGDDLPLGGASVTSFALLLHEFATNAAKYGALSSPAGRIAIECRDGGEQFVLVWTERGGPRIEAAADGEGFGSLLARATVRGQLGGEIAREWQPEGLAIRLTVTKARAAG
jgi:PAS domain S-box-containing protein